MVRWTPALRRHAALAWDERAREILGRTHRDVISRAATFLLLSDSRYRWLIHHVLSRAGYSPDGFVFPVSAAILRNVASYGEVLRSYSLPVMDLIRWEPTESGNVRVLNETADLYRYFDATAHAEFLYDRVE